MISPAPQEAKVVSAQGLTKTYRRGREEIRALDNLTFDIKQGEFVAIVGPSGAGKSTLLNLLGCMDIPTSGTLQLLGKSAQNLTEQERTRFRREQIGFVFQQFSLLPALTVLENVMLPAFFANRRPRELAETLLKKVGLHQRHKHRPHQLSGGEMQRTAIARALINSPGLLLADEPTGNLDQTTGRSVVSLFNELNRDGLTILVVTHNLDLAAAADRTISICDGRIVSATVDGASACSENRAIPMGVETKINFG